MIISFTASILRKYSGGVHASSPSICAFIGIVICVGFGLAFKLLLPSLLDITIVIVMGILVFTWSFYILFKLAPVDTPSKPIKREEKRKQMKKGSIILLIVYFLIITLSLILYIHLNSIHFLVYSICIMFGVVWQVFTLTQSGHKVINLLDHFFNIFSNIIKEAN